MSEYISKPLGHILISSILTAICFRWAVSCEDFGTEFFAELATIFGAAMLILSIIELVLGVAIVCGEEENSAYMEQRSEYVSKQPFFRDIFNSIYQGTTDDSFWDEVRFYESDNYGLFLVDVSYDKDMNTITLWRNMISGDMKTKTFSLNKPKSEVFAEIENWF